MNKTLKIMIITLILGGLAVLLSACGSESDEAELSEQEVVTVQRGNLTIDITAAGNLALSRTEDLAVDLFYQEGTVEEVLVEEGDTVEEGQVLAKLDIEEWEDELGTLDDKVTTAERQFTAEQRDLLQAQINLQTAEQTLVNAQDNKEAKELALLNKEIALDEAMITLRTGIAAVDVDAAEAQLRRATSWYEYVVDTGREAINAEDYLLALDRAEEQLQAAQTEYDNVLSGFDSNDIAIKKNQVEAAEMAVAQAQKDLDDVAVDITLKELQIKLKEVLIEDAQTAIVDAQGAVEDAEEALEEAKSKSPIITAPFAGFITRVNVEGGDEVLTGTIAVQLADPTKFEADVMVGEMDIFQVKLDGDALVQVDAMPTINLPAKVSHISPTATIQSGVVNYEVKVEIQSLQTIQQERQAARQDISFGQLPERLKQAMEEGRITQEQAEEIMKQRRQGEGGQPGQRQGQAPTMMPESFQLREGLTVTVSILVEQKNNVLLVPNKAIKREGGKTTIQVLKGDVTEERLIKTGINDYQNTEVIEGLSEGEQVVIIKNTSTTQTTSQSGGGIRIPGLGRPPRR